MTDIDDQRLRKLLSAFPVKAIELLYEMYYNTLTRISYRLTQNKEASEDIVQEAFVHLWEQHKKFENPKKGEIIHYLIKVVKNRSISCYKKQFKDRICQLEYLNGHDFSFMELPAELQMIQVEVKQQLKSLIHTFPEREQQCLLMTMEKGMDTKTIGESLAITQKAVQRSLLSGKRRLKRTWKA